jgi:hypothetical protein
MSFYLHTEVGRLSLHIAQDGQPKFPKAARISARCLFVTLDDLLRALIIIPVFEAGNVHSLESAPTNKP